MSEGKQGLAAALEVTGAGAPPPAATAEQLSMLPAPALSEPALTGAPTGGRPRGSRNRRTDEWVNYLLSRGRSPLEFLHSVYNRSVDSLARELGMFVRDKDGLRVIDSNGKELLQPGARLEALKLQIAAARELAPYVHQKLPVAIDVKGKTAGVILIGELPEGASQAGQALALFAAGELGEGEENQGFIEHPPQQSDGATVGNEAN